MQLFDIIGPVMIGPSSSHTAGAARIGRITRMLLGEEVQYADIRFHGSFAKTWEGHGTDRAVIGGLLGLQVDDERLRKSRALAEQAGMRYTISAVQLRDAHPNTALLELTGKSGKKMTIEASSVGGGAIVVNKIDGIDVNFTGDFNTLIVRNQDESGSVAAITSILSQVHINVANMSVNRHRRGGEAHLPRHRRSRIRKLLLLLRKSMLYLR